MAPCIASCTAQTAKCMRAEAVSFLALVVSSPPPSLLTRSLSVSSRGWDYPSVADKPWKTVRLVARPAQWQLDRISLHRCGSHPREDVPGVLVYFTLCCSTITIMFRPRAFRRSSLETEQDGILLISDPNTQHLRRCDMTARTKGVLLVQQVRAA